MQAALEYRNSVSADFGTVCHDLLDSYLMGTECENEEVTDLHLKTIKPVFDWVDENVDSAIFTERNFADAELRYGGTADMLLKLKNGDLLLADLKVKKDSYKFPMKPSMQYKYQLSAYRNHFTKEYGEMGIGNLLASSPFGSCKKSKVKPFIYAYQDWTGGFESAKRLWFERYEDFS